MPYKDLEKAKEYNRIYQNKYAKQRRKYDPEKEHARYEKHRETNRLQALIRGSRQSAKKRGLEHTITKDDLIQVEFCPLTGIKIDWSVSGKHMANPSIDRIDSTKGYVPGNVEIMSCLGNSMKSNATPEQMVHFAKEILKRYGSVSG
jgi:hypothetical protein